MSRLLPLLAPRSGGRLRAVGAASAVSAMAIGAGPAPAGAAPGTYAPLTQASPALAVPQAALSGALRCPSLRGAGRAPVLLISGTGVSPEQQYGWNWMPALTRRGIPFCTVALPHQGLGDVQTAGEYVVFAIRTMHAAAGRRISIVGASQGGMVPRWALRFWPDTRGMVDDLVGLAPDHHGAPAPAEGIEPACRATDGCPEASMQQAAGSRFLEALNSRRETFERVSYTNVRSTHDELLRGGTRPAAQTSESLASDGGRVTNVAVQELCPADVSGHVDVGTVSNVAYALALDALDHDGPADPHRVPASTCAASSMPGVDLLTLPAGRASLGTMSPAERARVPIVFREPGLQGYVGARDQADPGAERVRLVVRPRRLVAGRRTRVVVRATTTTGRPLRRERLRLLGRAARTDVRGRAVLTVRPATPGLRALVATGNGLPRATVRIRVARR